MVTDAAFEAYDCCGHKPATRCGMNEDRVRAETSSWAEQGERLQSPATRPLSHYAANVCFGCFIGPDPKSDRGEPPTNDRETPPAGNSDGSLAKLFGDVCGRLCPGAGVASDSIVPDAVR